MTRFLFLSFFCCLSANLFSQEIGYGFKAGLNFNTFKGDAETDDNGQALEDFSRNTGFHIGVAFTWEATELMGLRGEVMYSQKGGRRKYNGPSYYTFNTTTDSRLLSTGTRDQRLNITTSNIDIPVTAYFRPVEWLEIYGGANVAFMVSAPSIGSLKYSGTANGANISEFVLDVDANFITDDFAEAQFNEPATTITIGNEQAVIPSAAGAYFEFVEDRGNLYRIIDLGLVGGISFYLNKGFFISGRVNYGLTDITKTEADVSLLKLDNGEFISRNDDDRTFSFQTSVGFSF